MGDKVRNQQQTTSRGRGAGLRRQKLTHAVLALLHRLVEALVLLLRDGVHGDLCEHAHDGGGGSAVVRGRCARVRTRGRRLGAAAHRAASPGGCCGAGGRRATCRRRNRSCATSGRQRARRSCRSPGRNTGSTAAGWRSARGRPAWCRNRSRLRAANKQDVSDLHSDVRADEFGCGERRTHHRETPAHDAVAVLPLHRRGHPRDALVRHTLHQADIKADPATREGAA